MRLMRRRTYDYYLRNGLTVPANHLYDRYVVAVY